MSFKDFPRGSASLYSSSVCTPFSLALCDVREVDLREAEDLREERERERGGLICRFASWRKESRNDYLDEGIIEIQTRGSSIPSLTAAAPFSLQRIKRRRPIVGRVV